MTISPNSLDSAWVLEDTIRTAPAADSQWREQLDRLRPIASYAPESQTWRARLGALDLAGVQMLQILFGAASVHGTEVCLAPAAVPEHWEGPTWGVRTWPLLCGRRSRVDGRSVNYLWFDQPASDGDFEHAVGDLEIVRAAAAFVRDCIGVADQLGDSLARRPSVLFGRGAYHRPPLSRLCRSESFGRPPAPCQRPGVSHERGVDGNSRCR
ncbi:hypothetical protein ACWDG9_43905 [Streptomyces sp. NPDC001073]